MMNGVFAGKAMGVHSDIPSEEEIQENIIRAQEQGRKKRMLFKQGSGTFDTSKILGSSTGKSFNIEAMLSGTKKKSTFNIDGLLGRTKKKSNFNINKFLTTGGNKLKTKGDNMKNYNNKLKQFGIMTNNTKGLDMATKLKQFGIGTIKTSKNNDVAAKLKQFGIGKTINTHNKKLKQFGFGNTGINVNNKIRSFTGMNLNTGIGSKSINVGDKIRSFTGMNLKTGIRGLQKRATVKGINNTEMYGWNRIHQQRGLKPLGDFDGDKLVNMLDCNPRNKYKQGPMHDEDEMFPIANVSESNIIAGPVEGEVVDAEVYETPIQEAIEPVEADYINVTPTEEESNIEINLDEVGEKIKKGLGTAGAGIGSAAKYIGGAIAEKYGQTKEWMDEERKKAREVREQQYQDSKAESAEQKAWEKGFTRKVQEEALKQKFKKDVKQKVTGRAPVSAFDKYMQYGINRTGSGINKLDMIDKFGRNKIDKFGRVMKDAAYSSGGAMGIPGKGPSKIGQLIGGTSSGLGIREMAGQSGMIPFSEKVGIVAGRRTSEPFASKVASVTGKTGLEPSESFPMKVDYYVGGGKKREQLLEQEQSIYEKLKEQAAAKRELQEELATISSFERPVMQQPAMQQPAMQQPAMQQSAMQQSAMQQPTSRVSQSGKEWSEKSKRWVNYTRKSYSKGPRIEQQTY